MPEWGWWAYAALAFVSFYVLFGLMEAESERPPEGWFATNVVWSVLWPGLLVAGLTYFARRYFLAKKPRSPKED